MFKKLTGAVTACFLVMAGFMSCSDDSGEAGPGTRKQVVAPKVAGTVKLNDVVKESLEAAWAEIGSEGEYKIELGEGTYSIGEKQLAYNGSATIVISGPAKIAGKEGDVDNEYGLGCLINCTMKNDGTKDSKKRCLISMQGSGNLVLENVTLKQSGSVAGNNQLECIGYDGSGYVAAYNCSFLSHQDTMRTTGKAWFYKCYIEGDVDFLWMETSGKVALYEKCILCSVGDRTSRAYLTAPRSSPSANPVYKGLVVFDSEIWVDGIDTYLGRNPWSKPEQISLYYNNVAFVGTKCTKGSINGDFYSDCNKDSSIFFTGYNCDSNFKYTSYGKLNAAQIEAEYNGRNAIMNRCYTGGAIGWDSSEFNFEALLSKYNWTVDADPSAIN